MPEYHKIINSFNAGELSPLMDARIDQEKYIFGCRTMENFTPLIYGGAERRPGTEYIAGCISNSATSRLVAFEHSVSDTYILEFGNQVIRIFKDGAPVYKKYGTETLSGVGTPIAHWKMDDNAANTTVTDETTNHNGVASDDTDNLTISDAESTANAALDMSGNEYISVTDHDDLSFGDGSTDSPFSFIGWFYVTATSGEQVIIDKFSAANGEEYRFIMNADETISLRLHDDSGGPAAYIESKTTDSISSGWHFIGVTYSGKIDADAIVSDSAIKAGVRIYVDYVPVVATINNYSASYTAMENGTANFHISNQIDGWDGYVDNISVWNKELSQSEIASLTGNDQTTVVSVTTPYLTADLFELKFEHSADVLYITHPDYEPRKLSRYGDVSWVIEEIGLETGPFLNENDNINKTITASATTGSVTLTAVGCSPFIDGTTAGHEPSGSTATSKSITGTLFKLVHAAGTSSVSAELDATSLNDASSTLTVPKGVTWDFTTNGTWGQAGNSATVVLERSYDSGTTYETVATVTSAANKNITTYSTEDFAEAIYRARVSEAGGAGVCSVQLSIRDTSHIGIVEITAVTNGQTATATVLTTLGSTNATHRWSEGTFSNYRGWPIDVTISAEERLTFTGSSSYPLTTWGSVSGDFTDFATGTDDADAITFALVGTGQQNQIQWVIPKDALIIATVGGVHLLGASKDDEALTPTNVRARLQTTKGSENVAAKMINQAVLYVERGGRKIRELLYDYESDSHKADDLTIFANHVTESGIVDMAYQRTPDPILWCVRDDGEMAVMSYERDQKVFAWSRYVTADGTSDSEFESVAVIYGGANSEDEVWVTVKRTINSGTVRYVERFKTRDWGSDDDDAFFVDCGYTYDSTATSSITGLMWLEGETVQVYADGAVFDDATVASGAITLQIDGVTTTASVVQVGLAYTSTLKPMKLNIENLGLAATKKVRQGVISLYKTMYGEWGQDTSNMNPFYYIEAGDSSTQYPMYTGDIVMEFEGDYTREGDIIIRQTEPVPMTVLCMALDLEVNVD